MVSNAMYVCADADSGVLRRSIWNAPSQNSESADTNSEPADTKPERAVVKSVLWRGVLRA
jgi:hypothetical protein